MKRNFLFLLGAFYSTASYSQSFSFINTDTIKYGKPGEELVCYDTIVNNGATGYYVDVIRVQNTTASGWTSAICIDVCYPYFIDSARFYLTPNKHQEFSFHFYTGTVNPDSGTALVKFKNVSNPSNVIYQRFHGITRIGFGVNEVTQDVNVTTYPNPVISGSSISMNISDKKNTGNFSLLVYSIYGNLVYEAKDLNAGDNTLSLDLPTGLYAYSLLRGADPVYAGKIVIEK